MSQESPAQATPQAAEPVATPPAAAPAAPAAPVAVPMVVDLAYDKDGKHTITALRLSGLIQDTPIGGKQMCADDIQTALLIAKRLDRALHEDGKGYLDDAVLRMQRKFPKDRLARSLAAMSNWCRKTNQ